MRITVGGILICSSLAAGGILLFSPSKGPLTRVFKSVEALGGKLTVALGFQAAEMTPTPLPFQEMSPAPAEPPLSAPEVEATAPPIAEPPASAAAAEAVPVQAVAAASPPPAAVAKSA